METVVVNIHKEPCEVYIGRAGKGQDGYFGNPFSGPKAIDNFHGYFLNRLEKDPEFKRRVHQLKGKRLGCFCKPKPCHGDIIAEYLNSLPESVPIRLAVIGSRSFQNYEYLCEILGWYDANLIVSGGAIGADTLAIRYAKEKKIEWIEFIPEWTKYGKRAGFIRNRQIVAAVDEVIAFWNGKSPGTASSVRIADEMGKPCFIYWKDSVNDIKATDPLARMGL